MYSIERLDVDRNLVYFDKCIDLIYIKTGKARIITEGTTVDLNENECFFLDSTNPYILKPKDEELSIYRLEVSTEVLHKKLKIKEEYIKTGYIYDNDLNKYMDVLYKNKNEERVSRADLIESMVMLKDIVADNLKYNYLIGREKMSSDCRLNNYNKEDIILESLKHIDYLISNKEEVSLKKISEGINVSYSYLSRIFKEVTDYKFNTYLVQYKLERAVELLENTDVKISEVAYESGFVNIRNFNRVFKENMGLTPSKYRDNLMKERFM